MRWPWQRDRVWVADFIAEEIRRVRDEYRKRRASDMEEVWRMVEAELDALGTLEPGERWADDLPERLKIRLRRAKHMRWPWLFSVPFHPRCRSVYIAAEDK